MTYQHRNEVKQEWREKLGISSKLDWRYAYVPYETSFWQTEDATPSTTCVPNCLISLFKFYNFFFVILITQNMFLVQRVSGDTFWQGIGFLCFSLRLNLIDYLDAFQFISVAVGFLTILIIIVFFDIHKHGWHISIIVLNRLD